MPIHAAAFIAIATRQWLPASAQDWLLMPRLDDFPTELKKLFFLVIQLPRQPTDLIVLTVRVVITQLRVTEFVTATNHRDSLRHHEGREQVLALPESKSVDCRVRGFALNTAVPVVVVIV